MDPFQFIWEVTQSVFALFMAVALPLAVFWLIARQQTRKRDSRRASRGTARKASPTPSSPEAERGTLDRT